MDISDILLNVIEDILDRRIKKYENMDFKGVVVGKTANGKYNVKYNENIYLVPNGTNINFNIGDVVWIRKPNGKDTDQFIFANASYTK